MIVTIKTNRKRTKYIYNSNWKWFKIFIFWLGSIFFIPYTIIKKETLFFVLTYYYQECIDWSYGREDQIGNRMDCEEIKLIKDICLCGSYKFLEKIYCYDQSEQKRK